MVKLALVIAALAACQGQGSDTTTGSGSAPVRPADAAAPDAARRGSDDVPVPHPKPDEPDPPDPGKAIAELGAISAWQAVVDRAELLARRTQHGVVYGVIGPPLMVAAPVPATTIDAGVHPDAGLVASPYLWLVDDTEGLGSLGIHILAGPKGSARKLGDRVALGGAWALDDDHHWYWKVDAVDPLAATEKPNPKEDASRAAIPGHVIANGDLPNGARTISLAKDNDAVYFQIVGPAPTTDGDGWPVADELGNPTFALLNLPGERPSYGGHDMRTADERWTLRRGVTYALRIGKIRKRADKPALINARSAPVRVK
jgi:hypothetical protein